MRIGGIFCAGLGALLLASAAFGQVYQRPAAGWQTSRQASRPAVTAGAYASAADDSPTAPMPPPPIIPAAPPVTTPLPPISSPAASDASIAGAQVSSGSCTAGCNSCGGSCSCAPCCCCSNMWEHETGFFAEYMYLRPFGANVSYGIQQNGVGGLGTVPAGDVGVVSPQFDNGYRFGLELACSCTSGIRGTYTNYQTSTHDTLLQADGIGGTAASLLLHPGTIDAASTFSELDAFQSIKFRMADIDYSVLVNECCTHAINFNVGVRYAHLNEDFAQIGVFSGAEGEEDVFTNIRFDGVGLRTGLDGQWKIGDSRFSAYGWGFINVLFGEFSSRYQQFNATTTTVEAASNWSDDRCVPILDYEVGLRWTSCNGHWQVGSGYYTAFWFNTVTTGDFVRAVQSNDFTHVDKTIAFTGFTTRVEFRF